MTKKAVAPLAVILGVGLGTFGIRMYDKYMEEPTKTPAALVQEQPQENCYRAGGVRICRDATTSPRNEEMDQLERCYHIIRERTEQLYRREPRP